MSGHDIRIPSHVSECSELSDHDFRVYAACRSIQGSQHTFTAHYSYIGERAGGKDKANVCRAIKRLCEAGFMARDDAGNMTCTPAKSQAEPLSEIQRTVVPDTTPVVRETTVDEPQALSEIQRPLSEIQRTVVSGTTGTKSQKEKPTLKAKERERTREEDLILASPLERAVAKAQTPVEIYRAFLAEWMVRNHRPGRPAVPERFQTLIAHAVKDSEAWESHLFRWLETGYQLLNVTALLDAYDEAELAVRAPPPPVADSYDTPGNHSAADALYEELAAGMNQPD